MESDISEVIERLRGSRSLSWLRVIDAAQLDGSPEDEPDAEAVVGPYRWLLKRVDDGVQLTGAGYLPPALVVEAMGALGWGRDWYGKQNREIHAGPLLELRESAQRLGLLRKNRGQLLVTKLGRGLVDDPHRLWWHLAERLPDAREEPRRHAGILYLLSVAAGRPQDDALLAEGMSILGWADGQTRQPLTPHSAFFAARDTWVMFYRLGMVSRTRRLDASELPSPTGIRLARAALLGRVAASSPAPEPLRRAGERAVRLTVTLRDIEPAIWRQVVVPASLTLRELHDVIQTAMGWQNYHLHLFDIDGVRYGDIEDMAGPLGEEETFTIGQVAKAVTGFRYDYDFGDGWEHDIRIEQAASIGIDTPQLIGGARACPPEDCGGPGGYRELLEAVADPAHPQHEELLQWVGGAYDPEAFDVEATNADLELYDRQTRQRRRP